MTEAAAPARPHNPSREVQPGKGAPSRIYHAPYLVKIDTESTNAKGAAGLDGGLNS
jgi:hypothetical protein